MRLSAFGATNVFIAPVGNEELLGEPDETGEDGQEEIYVVLRGARRFEVDDEVLEVGGGLSREAQCL